jgi:hypothetical protein
MFGVRDARIYEVYCRAAVLNSTVELIFVRQFGWLAFLTGARLGFSQASGEEPDMCFSVVRNGSDA